MSDEKEGDASMGIFIKSEAEKRKKRSIAVLKKQSIPYIDHLPVIADKSEVKLKTPLEIAKRVIASMITIQVACEIQNECEDLEDCRSFFREQLTVYDVADCLTEQEMKIFSAVPSQQEVIDVIWKYEACWVLFWALGMVSKLDFPGEICDCEAAIGLITRHNSLDSFTKTIQMRPVDEILDAADLNYRYDWACVNARIDRKSLPCGLNESVVVERHKALNWLIGADGAEGWDKIVVNT